MLASLRHYRLAPLVWGTGLGLATFTGYLRIAADKHYFTDVVVGAAFGSLVGFLVPYVFHRADDSAPAMGAGRPALIGWSGTF